MASKDGSASLIPPILLLLAAVSSIGIANSSLAPLYFSGLSTKINLTFGPIELLDKSLLYIINDGLMAIFFLFIGLELKREIIVGELSSIKASTLPIFAALGGMIAPALFYTFINIQGPGENGWGIPMATDIAFALGILTILGSRIPTQLKVILAAIAIVDDLGAILVIAIFYTNQIHLDYLFFATITAAIGIGLNFSGVKKLSVYALIGLPMWYFTLKSGIHATIAGVVLGGIIPLSLKDCKPHKLISNILNHKASLLDSPAIFLEKSLYKWIGLVIVPLFAFANAGVTISTFSIGPIGYGIIAGLVFGKPAGVLLLTFLGKSLGLLQLPKDIAFAHLFGIGCLAGIGFTMSLFIGSLAFENELSLLNEAKVGILIASVISGLLGSLILLSITRVGKQTKQ